MCGRPSAGPRVDTFIRTRRVTRKYTKYVVQFTFCVSRRRIRTIPRAPPRRGLHSRHALQRRGVLRSRMRLCVPSTRPLSGGSLPRLSVQRGFDAVVQSKRLALPLSFPRNGEPGSATSHAQRFVSRSHPTCSLLSSCFIRRSSTCRSRPAHVFTGSRMQLVRPHSTTSRAHASCTRR
jgi:hypothetical protein